MGEEPKDEKYGKQYRKPKNKINIKALINSNIFWVGAEFIIVIKEVVKLMKIIKFDNTIFIGVN